MPAKKTKIDFDRLVESACNFLDAYTDVLKQTIQIRAEREKALDASNKLMQEMLLVKPDRATNDEPTVTTGSSVTTGSFSDLGKIFGPKE